MNPPTPDAIANEEPPTTPPAVDSPVHRVVTTLFAARGLPESEWRTTLAEAMGRSYSTAERRLIDEEQFTIGELRAIAKHFGTTVSLMLQAANPEEQVNPEAKPATLRIGEHRVPCNVTTRSAYRLSAEALVAYEGQDGLVYVTPQSEAESGAELKAIRYLEIRPPRAFRIAVLDDALSAAVPVVRLLNGRGGFEASAYTSAAQVLALLKRPHRPHGYILDWTLEDGKNSGPLIREIRAVDPHCPIFLLTGTIQANEGEIGQVVQAYKVQVHLKPARTAILAASLRSLLEDGQETIPFTQA